MAQRACRHNEMVERDDPQFAWECADCGHVYGDAELEERENPRDEAYERAAARARGNDFEDTDGNDWT